MVARTCFGPHGLCARGRSDATPSSRASRPLGASPRDGRRPAHGGGTACGPSTRTRSCGHVESSGATPRPTSPDGVRQFTSSRPDAPTVDPWSVRRLVVAAGARVGRGTAAPLAGRASPSTSGSSPTSATAALPGPSCEDASSTTRWRPRRWTARASARRHVVRSGTSSPTSCPGCRSRSTSAARASTSSPTTRATSWSASRTCDGGPPEPLGTRDRRAARGLSRRHPTASRSRSRSACRLPTRASASCRTSTTPSCRPASSGSGG